MVVHRSSAMSIRIMGRNPTSSEWVEIRPGIDEENEEIPGILIARIRDSRMTFGKFIFVTSQSLTDPMNQRMRVL